MSSQVVKVCCLMVGEAGDAGSVESSVWSVPGIDSTSLLCRLCQESCSCLCCPTALLHACGHRLGCVLSSDLIGLLVLGLSKLPWRLDLCQWLRAALSGV